MESSCQRGTFIILVSTVCLFFVTGVVSHEDITTATCTIKPLGTVGNISGTITLTQSGFNGSTTVVGKLVGFSNSTTDKRGFHVHEYGILTDDCKDAKDHFNPLNQPHGGPNDTVRHVGDLGNIVVNSNLESIINITDKMISLHGNNSIVNRAIVVHSGEDDLGRGETALSNTTGNSGIRIGCCVITLSSEVTTSAPSPSQTTNVGSTTSVGPLTGILLICLAGLHLLMKSIQM